MPHPSHAATWPGVHNQNCRVGNNALGDLVVSFGATCSNAKSMEEKTCDSVAPERTTQLGICVKTWSDPKKGLACLSCYL